MRLLVAASITLAVVALLARWDAGERYAAREPTVHASAPETGQAPRRPAGPSQRTAGKPDRAAAATQPAPGAATPAETAATPPTARAAAIVPGSLPRSADMASGSAARVRHFAPGSRDHAQIVASVITSEPVRETVGPVARLYLAYFDRPPDYEGLDYYIGEREGGTPLGEIADDFAGSLEFEMRYGELDNAAFVDLVFRNVVAGPAEAARRAYWIARLDSGAMTRGELMVAFSEAAGFRALTANEVFVIMAYAETLSGSPDAAALARWVRFLDAGNPPQAVIDALLAGSRRR